MGMASTLIIQALIALVSLIIYQQLFRKSKNLPPGPKGVPLIGNIFDVPSKDTTDTDHWRSMTDKYGPITSINLFGQTTIFIADKEAAQEILEKKCSKSSSRPAFRFSIYSGFGGIVSMHQYDRRFKFHRKLMHKGFGTKRLVSRHAGIQEQKAGWLLLQTLKAPEQILQHMEK
jgi:cytochrome P450